MYFTIYFRRIDQLPIINSTHDHVIMQLAFYSNRVKKKLYK